MAHVASGTVDAFFEDGYGGPWDMAAGYVLVTEAGGMVCTPEGDPFVMKLGKGALIPRSLRVDVNDACAHAVPVFAPAGKLLCGPKPVCDDISRIVRAADSSLTYPRMSPTSAALSGAIVGAGLALLITRYLK